MHSNLLKLIWQKQTVAIQTDLEDDASEGEHTIIDDEENNKQRELTPRER